MSVRNLTEGREAVSAGQLDVITGTRECSWLDVKKEHYRLGNPASNVELAKDVTAFANAAGGLLIIGFETRQPDGGGEVVGAITPVSSTAVTAEQYRKVLRSQVFPLIRDLSVEWAVLDGGTGVLVVDVPEQSDTDKPFLVPGRTDREGFSLPIRDGDGTLWLSLENVQRLLSIGWNAKDGVDREEVLRLVHQAAAAAASVPPEPVIRVGQGIPEARRAFEQAYASAGGEPVLGTPIEPGQSIGGGYVQPFSSGAVICSIIGQPAIAVSEDVWSAIAAIGSRSGRYGPAALGLPDVVAMSASLDVEERLAILDEGIPDILLKNGSWGPARLFKRPGVQGWSWEPIPVVDSNVLNRWSALEPLDFRVRAVATLPLYLDELPDRARIDPARRRQLETILRSGRLANFMSVLSLRRGKPAAATSWHWPTGEQIYQSDRHGECRSSLTLPDGTRAVEMAVLVQLATGNQMPSLITCVELRIFQQPMADFFAGSGDSADQRSVDLRVSVPELVEFFLAAWPVATLDAPWAALPIDVRDVPLIGPPRVEFQFEASPSGVGDRVRMDEVLDMSAYGQRSRSIPDLGAVGITAPLDQPDDERRRLLVRGLTELAQAWGFMEANEANV